jgi:alpha-galactosidase
MDLKITLIGAGSVVFAKTLISDVLQFPELSHATICLMDIDPQRLKVAELMTKKIIQALKVPAKVIATTDRRKAVKGAKYVICTIQVGGYKPGTIIDFEIPKKYGLQQTIADTLGVGGVFRALRTIPEINAIAQDIADVGAPGCLLLNYTNPMAMNCWAVDRAVGIPHVGLCHSVQGTSQQLASFANLNYSDVSYKVAGINHMAFFLQFEYKGQDAYPLLFKLLEDPSFDKEKVRFEMMRRLGYFVTESSEHQSEYTPYFIHHGKEIIQKFDIPIDEYLRRCESIITIWTDTEAKLLGKSGEIEVKPQSHEYGSFIIHSSETNIPRVVYGNVPNRNLITNLPQGCCVEVPCLVNAQGLQPTVIGDLPPQLAAICQTNVNVQSLTVEAAITGKREHIYHAVMLDPHTATVMPLDKIWAMCDELIEAHQKVGLLGSFKPTVKNTGRSHQGLGDQMIAEVSALSALQAGKNEIPLEICVTNPNPTPITLQLKLQEKTKSVRFEKNGRISIKVGAHKTARQKVKSTVVSDGKQALEIELSTSTPNVFTRSVKLTPRQMLSGKGEASFEVKLAGFPAVEAKITRQKDSLRFHYHVLDSNIKTDKSQLWVASGVELFFSTLTSSTPIQLWCLPQPDKKAPIIIDRQFLPIPHARGTQKISKSDYLLDFEIPFSSIGLDETTSKEFLFDTAIQLNALGDAHSGGKTALSGQFESYLSNTHYSVVKLV